MSPEAGGENGGVVPEKGVAAAQKLRQIGEGVVGERAAGAIDDKEPGLIAARSGSLRDQARGKRIVEEIGRERHERGGSGGEEREARRRGSAGRRAAFEACACPAGEFLPLLTQSPS